MKISKNIIFPFLLTISLSLGSGSYANPDNNVIKSSVNLGATGGYVQNIGEDAQIDWTKNVITVTGAGAPPDRGNNAQKRLMAQRAAKADAYRQLVEVINGVHVSSQTIVKDFVTESDEIKTEISGLVQGAEQLGDYKYLPDGSVEIQLQIKLFSADNTKTNKYSIKEPDKNTKIEVTEHESTDSIASILMPDELKRRQNDKVPDTKLRPDPVLDTYTSLILDCKGLGVVPAMSPAIFDADDGEVYVGSLPIDPDYVINEGIVSYATTMAEAKKLDRAGNKPLELKATNVKGLFKADVYVSNSDAKKLIGAEQRGKFLQEFRVILVI
jgi:hypothetical protein